MARDDAAKLRVQYKREDAELAALEQAAEELRVAYDHYFLGIEKREPQKQRTDLERTMRRSDLFDANRATVRFRFSTLRHRMATYATYWDRTVRQIEEGTFRREGALRRPGGMRAPEREFGADTVEDTAVDRVGAPSEAAQAAEELLRSLGAGEDPALSAGALADVDATTVRQAGPGAALEPGAATRVGSPPPARHGPPPVPRAPGGPPPIPRVRPHDGLYRQFVAARRNNNESDVSYEAFETVVQRTARPGASFEVAVKDGKTTLVLKRGG